MTTTFRSVIDFASWLTKREIPATCATVGPDTLAAVQAEVEGLEVLPIGHIRSTTNITVKVRLPFEKTHEGHRLMGGGTFLEKPKSIRRTKLRTGAGQEDSWVLEHVEAQSAFRCSDAVEEVLAALPHEEFCGIQKCEWEGELTMPLHDVAVWGGICVPNTNKHGQDAVLYFPFTLEDYEAAIDFAETDPYGALEYAVGSSDDFVCFDFHQHENGDFTLHSVVNSETGGFIQDLEHPYRVTEDRAVSEALGLIDQGLAWGYNNGVRHSKRGWNQDPYFFAREVAAAIARRHGVPYKRVPRKNGKIPTC
jgi:hypothetical protein